MRDVLLDRNAQHGRWLDVMGIVAFGGLAGILPALAMIYRVPMVPLEWVMVGLFATIPLLAALVTALHVFGKELLVLDGDRLYSSRRAGPWGHAWSVALEDITLLRVPGLGREMMQHSWGVGVPALVVKTRSRTRRCCFAVYPPEAEAIASKIRSAMALGPRGETE
jgi:hypothetical protein